MRLSILRLSIKSTHHFWKIFNEGVDLLSLGVKWRLWWKLTLILGDYEEEDLMWRPTQSFHLSLYTYIQPVSFFHGVFFFLAFKEEKSRSDEPFRRCWLSIDIWPSSHRIDNVPPQPPHSIADYGPATHFLPTPTPRPPLCPYVNGILSGTWIKHQMDRMCVDSISHLSLPCPTIHRDIEHVQAICGNIRGQNPLSTHVHMYVRYWAVHPKRKPTACVRRTSHLKVKIRVLVSISNKL